MRDGSTKRQLEVTTPTDREIVMTRVFDAPRERVFDAFTTPGSVKRWLIAPAGWTLAVCDIALRVGGAFRYVWRNDADGQEFVVRGVYTDITRPERVVHTERFDDPAYPGESVETWTFDEVDGSTTFTMTLAYESIEARNRALESGMDQGNAACYDRLDSLLV
ncbi:MAG: SRPBCC family protein [Candidatus Eremiobacteraeota bacterium]|nr:SRPBCC family protein [Candidatus Eremiobacteraeota bacterium]